MKSQTLLLRILILLLGLMILHACAASPTRKTFSFEAS